MSAAEVHSAVALASQLLPGSGAPGKRAGPQLAHLHLVDSHRLAPGGGHIDFAPILSALRTIDYTGYVSFEFFWITPRLAYLPTFEACDAEVANGLEHLRDLRLV